jgi:hypothetical protein
MASLLMIQIAKRVTKTEKKDGKMSMTRIRAEPMVDQTPERLDTLTTTIKKMTMRKTMMMKTMRNSWRRCFNKELKRDKTSPRETMSM